MKVFYYAPEGRTNTVFHFFFGDVYLPNTHGWAGKKLSFWIFGYCFSWEFICTK